MADQSTSAVQTPQTRAAQDSSAGVVETFFNALQERDFDAAESVLAQNLVYQNVGFPTLYGRNRTVKLFRSMPQQMGFEVRVHRIATEGATVLTERTDALTFGPLRVQFWVCGVFEIHDGRITLWRDYFDLFDCTKALIRGLVGIVVPSLRPTL
jgi:limonene-1,2-epoxide hydrolase